MHLLTPVRGPILASLALWAASGAWAQSGYTMATLSPPSGGQVAAGDAYDLTRSFGIDAQGNVVGPARYPNGWYFDSNPPYLRKRYDYHVVRWPASSGSAAVSPTKLHKAATWSFMKLDVSSSTNKVLVYSKTQAVLDVPTLKLGAALPTMANQQDAKLVNDAGTVLWLARSTNDGGLIGASGLSQTLPSPDASGIRPRWVNNLGTVAGDVQLAGESMSRAAIWSQGQITVVDPRSDRGSRGLMINDAGMLLAESLSITCFGSNCGPLPDSQGLLANGVYQAIVPTGASAGATVQVQNMNNLGQVVGYASTDGSTNGRGFLWKDGQYRDLTTWLPSQGVTLPVGSRIRFVMAINDAGAMVAELVSFTNVATLVRLTPKP